MIPNIKIGVRQIPSKNSPYLHVMKYNDNSIDYFSDYEYHKIYKNSIGVWKPKKNSVIKK